MKAFARSESRAPSRRRRLAALLAGLGILGMAGQLAAVSPASAQTWSATLNGGPANRLVGTTATLTATFSSDVGPTPYYHMIYDRGSGQLLRACASGTTCSTTVTYSVEASRTYVAVRARYSATYPPPEVQTTTNQVTITWRKLVLTTSHTTQQARSMIDLTAYSSTDVGPTPYVIHFFDVTLQRELTSCSSGTVCRIGLTENEWWRGTHQYVAAISDAGTQYPPTGVQAWSNPVYVTWT